MGKQKPCDEHPPEDLDCVHFGKCYGYCSLKGTYGKPKFLHEVQKCPYEDLAIAALNRNRSRKK